jgi:hypothetical protein
MMKKNYLFKNIGRTAIVLGMLATTLLSSCLKDTSPGSLDLSKSPALVGWQYYGFAATPLTTKLHGIPSDQTSVKVTLSVASITMSSAVTVQIADDPTDAQAYADAQNTAAGATTTFVLPSSDYTIGGSSITIPAGQQYATINVKYAGDKIDFTKNYVMGLKITSASGAIVASNLNVAILAITLQSNYEGDYSDNGFVLRAGDNVLGGYFKGQDEQLSTISADAVSFQINWATDVPAAGVGGTQIAVNPATNAVTMSSTANATLTNLPGYNSHYDPATKTFYIAMTWNTPGTRQSIDTLTYQGPL